MACKARSVFSAALHRVTQHIICSIVLRFMLSKFQKKNPYNLLIYTSYSAVLLRKISESYKDLLEYVVNAYRKQARIILNSEFMVDSSCVFMYETYTTFNYF